MTRPCELGAVEARALMAGGSLSPVELVESCIARVEQADPALNALVTRAFDRALDEARATEQALLERRAAGLLHGLPIGIKDLNDTAGIRTTYGSLLFRDHVPREDEHLVAAVRAAGAIVLGKTNTPEFGAGGNTDNKLFGPTRNPFDPEKTCGGSSGGSAVVLAAGMMPLASGSDTGGSLRLPASYCGVVAHRPSPGVIPNDRRSQAYSTYQMNGPMARSVADVSLLLAAMAARTRGHPPADPMSGPLAAEDFRRPPPRDLSRLRVAVSGDLGVATVSRVVRDTFRDRVSRMTPLFAEVRECDPPLDGALDVFWYLRGVYMLAKHEDMAARYGEDVNPNVRSNLAAARTMTAEQIARASREQYRLTANMHRFLGEVDALICPCVSVPPFPCDQLYPTEIDGEPMDNYVHWAALTSAITVTGNPVVTLPCGTHPDGTPFGIQVVGRLHEDRALLGIAAALEAAMAEVPGCERPVPPFTPAPPAPAKC